MEKPTITQADFNTITIVSALKNTNVPLSLCVLLVDLVYAYEQQHDMFGRRFLKLAQVDRVAHIFLEAA